MPHEEIYETNEQTPPIISGGNKTTKLNIYNMAKCKKKSCVVINAMRRMILLTSYMQFKEAEMEISSSTPLILSNASWS